MDDVLVNKAAVVRRCLARVAEEYAGDPRRIEDFTRQDAVVLNVQRACEACIDLAMHVVAQRRLGVPQDARNAFELLQAAGMLDAELAVRMKRMVGFRNVAVHEYQALSTAILRRVLDERLGDFDAFVAAIFRSEEGIA